MKPFFVRLLIYGWGLLGALLLLVSAGHGAVASEPERLWIDTDPACGLEGRHDPDDCFALAAMLGAAEFDVVGVSTVFGNAALEEVHAVAEALLRASGPGAPPLHRGATEPGDKETEAAAALRAALADAPLTILALGPATNIAAALQAEPALAARVTRLVAVMGKREGHMFHPAEGATGGSWFGHGPIFRDFNVCQDNEAARELMGHGLDVTLVPYEAARQMSLGAEDLDRLLRAGGLGAFVAARSFDWLAYWREAVGRDGFYPFDLVAAGALLSPGALHCPSRGIAVREDEKAPRWMGRHVQVLVESQAAARTVVRYCTALMPGLKDRLLARLNGLQG